MLLNQKLKFTKYVVVACCIILPWNATAVINNGGMADKLFSQKFGRNLIDMLLVKSLLEITQGNTKQALDTVNELIRTTPNFKLAYLIRGDLISSQGRALAAFGDPDTALPSPVSNEEIKGLRDEARTRIDYYLSDKKTSQHPNLLVKLSPEQQHIIVVDAQKSRLFLYKNVDDHLQYVADYYVTIGKNGFGKQVQGDKRTPVGVYFAGKKLTQPLDDMYGDAAYPLNYPNELDLYHNKTGSGIWLHGTPTNTYSRPPRASDGCVVLSKPDLKALEPILKLGQTPVIIASNLEWLEDDKADQINAKTEALQQAIENWRKDWVSQNTDAYLSHYSNKFFYSDGGLDKWADYKRDIQAGKPKVAIEIKDLSMFDYPSASVPKFADQKVVVVNFEQDFSSASLQNKMRKRQYWAHENNEWKIIYEGAG
jgi:murein L,D-transpeptidase YafK